MQFGFFVMGVIALMIGTVVTRLVFHAFREAIQPWAAAWRDRAVSGKADAPAQQTNCATAGCCPHCGSRLPIVRDAFCTTCGKPLDEPPALPRPQTHRPLPEATVCLASTDARGELKGVAAFAQFVVAIAVSALVFWALFKLLFLLTEVVYGP